MAGGSSRFLFAIAFWINGEINFATGITAFFLEQTQGLMSLKRNAMMLCSGLMVPLHFLEGLIGVVGTAIMTSLPFAWIGYWPTLAYVGQLEHPGTIIGLGLVWGLSIRCLNIWLWRKAARRP